MRDIVTAGGKGFDQDSSRAGNANVPTGRTTANQEPQLGTISAPQALLQRLSEDEVRLRRANGQGNTVKLPTSRSYAQILRENILTVIHLILFALSGVLLLRIMRFVLPVILTASLATLFVFLTAVALAVSRGLPEATVIATARSTITVFATVCGILLLVFVAPPTRFLAGGNTLSGDWRPMILAAVLLGGLTVLLSVPLGRAVFEIGALPLFNTAAIVSVALRWALLLRFAWRFRLLERILGIAVEAEPEKGLSPSRSMVKDESI